MRELRYNIVMYVPLGKRYGTMTVRVEKELLNGEIHILQHSEGFQGRKKEDGSVEISGKLTTLMRMIPYNGSGTISPEKINLRLLAGDNVFEIEGTPCTEGGQ